MKSLLLQFLRVKHEASFTMSVTSLKKTEKSTNQTNGNEETMLSCYDSFPD